MGRKNNNITYRSNPDLLYGDCDIEKFINIIMIHGRKTQARNIVYSVLHNLHKRIGDNSLTISELFGIILRNVMPSVDVKSKRVGGATYQVPVELQERRSKMLAMVFFHTAIRKHRSRKIAKKESRKRMSTCNFLADEMYEAYYGRGEALKMKDEKHKVAKMNMSYAHYR